MTLYPGEDNRVPLYSKYAVVGFCVFFSPLFGGILLNSNLKQLGLKKEGLLAIFLGLLMASITALFSTTPLGGPGTTFVINLLQGILLAEFYFRKFMPEADMHPRKNIVRPVVISLLVVFILLFLLVLTGTPLLPKQ